MAIKRILDEARTNEPQAKKAKLGLPVTQVFEPSLKGDSEQESKVLKSRPPMNEDPLNLISNLHEATKNGQFKVVKELLEKKINIDLRNKEGKTALHLASMHGHTEIVTEILLHGAKVDIETDRDANYEDYREDDGKTALHLASENGHAEIVAILLQNGADVNRKLEFEKTYSRPLFKDHPEDMALHMANKKWTFTGCKRTFEIQS